MSTPPRQRDHVRWHELRSPAGTLVTLLDLMADGIAGEAPPELRDLIERAKRQSERLMEMLAAVHDVERLRWGTLQIRKEPVDLARLLRKTATVVEGAAKRRGTTLALELEEPLEIKGDPVLLARCLDTLMRAAIEASAPGGSLRMEARMHEGQAALAASVGTPADPQALAQAFTEESSLGIRGGVGLGLYEVRLLVEAMGGSVRSEAGTLELRVPGG